MRRRLLSAACLLSMIAPAAWAHPKETAPHAQGAELQMQIQPRGDRPNIEVAFVLDTTGSMGGLIEGAKEKIWSIASQIARGKPTPRLKVALVAYRDIGDEYVTKKFDLTNDLDSVFVNLKSFHAAGGGDEPEHVGRGLGEAVSQLSWSKEPNTLKMIFLVGDAPPHIYNDGWNYRDWAKEAAKRNIVVNTIRCGMSASTELAWREIARPSGGSFITIQQSGGMVAMATPYDEKMAKLNAEIATKTIYVGEEKARRKSKALSEDVAAMPAASAADRASFMHASGAAMGPAAVGGSRLITAPTELATVKDADLPEDLRTLDAAKRKERVAELSKERSALEGELSKLAARRDEWVKKNAPKKADSFDSKVTEVLKDKAQAIGVAY